MGWVAQNTGQLLAQLEEMTTETLSSYLRNGTHNKKEQRSKTFNQ